MLGCEPWAQHFRKKCIGGLKNSLLLDGKGVPPVKDAQSPFRMTILRLTFKSRKNLFSEPIHTNKSARLRTLGPAFPEKMHRGLKISLLFDDHGCIPVKDAQPPFSMTILRRAFKGRENLFSKPIHTNKSARLRTLGPAFPEKMHRGFKKQPLA